MTTPRLASAIAAVFVFASRAAAHGPAEGALHPHLHPHAEEASGGWGMVLVVAALAGGVALLVRAIAKRR